MSKSLIIVESPTKARTISKYLGRGYAVMASVGHVKDLPENKLGVDILRNFTPQYVTIKGKAQVLAEIKKKAKEADKVYLAPDPDREGEAIAWHIAQEIDGKAIDGKAKGKARKVLGPLQRDHRVSHQARAAVPRADRHEPGQRPTGPARARSHRRLPGQPVAVEEGPPGPQHGPRAVGGRQVDLRPRARARGLPLGGVLDHCGDAGREAPAALRDQAP